MEPPILSIGIVSYNRLRYLRVLVASIRECIDVQSAELLLADGGSTEIGHAEFRESLTDFRVRSQAESHAESMNWLIANARGRYLLLLPEDIQFIRKGPWVKDAMELLGAVSSAGMVVFDAQRKVTVRNQLVRRRRRWGRWRLPFWSVVRCPNRYVGEQGEEFFSAGDSRDGVSVAGIMSLSRTELWRELGPFRPLRETPTGPENDSSLGAEEDMILRVRSNDRLCCLEAYLMKHPAAADIITDSRGTKAKIRMGNWRYGTYADPPQPPFYYRIREGGERGEPPTGYPVWSFEDWVEPVGWSLPVDGFGNLRKVSVIEEGEIGEPVEEAPGR